jgi:1,4-alpha-glucan branching enzyme
MSRPSEVDARLTVSPDRSLPWRNRKMPAKRTMKAGTVDVAFSLSADVQADTVGRCGEFNEWSPEAVQPQREDDGIWLATVALEPWHAHRYRYLLDGGWENAWGAEWYVPNPYGSDDSVVVV